MMIMYIYIYLYNVLIDALSAHLIHVNLNTILYYIHMKATLIVVQFT